jgi:hypothetical protein
MTKTGTTGWNSGAVSLGTLAGDGYAQFTTAEATTDKVAGLSVTDPAQNYAAIDFGLDLTSAGALNVIEDGAFVFTGGTYAANDVLKVQVSGAQVTYLKNGTLVYTSTKSPTLPLFFGTSLYTPGATINSFSLVPSSLVWTDAVGVTTSGASMTKTGAAGWNAGAASLGSLSGNGFVQFTTAEATTDKVAGLSAADPAQNYAAVDFGINLTSSGGLNVIEDGAFVFTGGTYAANDVLKVQVSGTTVTYLKNNSVIYTSTKSATFPLLFGTSLFTTGATITGVALSQGFWQDAVGVSTSGSSMTKTGAFGWNSGAASFSTLTGNGNVQFTTAEATSDKVAGLSATDPVQNYAAIDFGLDLTSTGGVNVIEDGLFAFTGGTYAANDVFNIQLAGSIVLYLKNGTVLYSSTKTPTFPLLFGTSMYTPGGTVNSVTFSSGSAVNWTKAASPIFKAKCAACHTTGGAGGVNFANVYSDTQVTANPSVCTGAANTTVGACTIVRIKNGSMPRNRGCSGNPVMDANNANCLTQAEQNIVQAWITGGELQ